MLVVGVLDPGGGGCCSVSSAEGSWMGTGCFRGLPTGRLGLSVATPSVALGFTTVRFVLPSILVVVDRLHLSNSRGWLSLFMQWRGTS